MLDGVYIWLQLVTTEYTKWMFVVNIDQVSTIFNSRSNLTDVHKSG
jgi:hypothetical protein